MNYKNGSIIAVMLLSSCGGESRPELAQAFPDLENNKLEIRLGNMPDLTENQCNRNMYAGFRSQSGEPIKLTISLTAAPDGASIERHKRELLLEPTSSENLLVGQTPLFPSAIQQSCKEIDVKMFTMSCTYGPETEPRACPQNIRWQWLQGFKMISPP